MKCHESEQLLILQKSFFNNIQAIHIISMLKYKGLQQIREVEWEYSG